jgi:hypothetical protein
LNKEAGRGIPIVLIQSGKIAHVLTLDWNSLNLQLGKGRRNWYEVQITGRCIALPGRPA